MKTMVVAVEVEYDKMRVTPNEVIFNVRLALDEHFNRMDNEYDEDALRILSVYENVSDVLGRDKD